MGVYDTLHSKIKKKNARIGVVGLGYVGLPLAILFAKKGFVVTGFVRRETKKVLLEKGESGLSDVSVDKDLSAVIKRKTLRVAITNKNDLSNQDVCIICVPTPITEGKVPDLQDLKSAADVLKSIDVTGKLIINESTVAPFTTREVFGTMQGEYFLACSPERIDPGNKTKKTNTIPKVIGGVNSESTQLAEALYTSIMKESLVTVSSLEAAEMAKMLENTYRAVNIALVNEFALLAEKLNIDILEVIRAAKTKWSYHSHYPGIGVGGHCIPVDPYYILSLADKNKIPMHVVKEGLLANEKMPAFVAGKIINNYKQGKSVLVYGVTYKKDVNDIRESPVVVLCNLLKEKNVTFTVYDPFISPSVIQKYGFIPGKVGHADILVVGTDHTVLARDYEKIVDENTIVIDGRNFFSKKVGKKVLGVGRRLA